MRVFVTAFFLLLLIAPQARAADARCFGPEKAWCAWAVREDRPDDGWRVAYKSRMNDAVVQTVIDTPGNRPRLSVRVTPASETDSAQVIISLRSDDQHPDQWRQFVGRNREFENGGLRVSLGRRALEALLEAPVASMLYVFVEFKTPSASRKDSYKIPLAGLNEALRFARLGR